MSGLDVSRLSPDDVVAALRSFPRRFRELFESVHDREVPDESTSSPDDVLAFLTMEANEAADRITHVPPEAWTRTGTIAGSGETISALDIAREAVRTGAEHLRAAERAIG
jgi:hypothetical protein